MDALKTVLYEIGPQKRSRALTDCQKGEHEGNWILVVLQELITSTKIWSNRYRFKFAHKCGCVCLHVKVCVCV